MKSEGPNIPSTVPLGSYPVRMTAEAFDGQIDSVEREATFELCFEPKYHVRFSLDAPGPIYRRRDASEIMMDLDFGPVDYHNLPQLCFQNTLDLSPLECQLDFTGFDESYGKRYVVLTPEVDWVEKPTACLVQAELFCSLYMWWLKKDEFGERTPDADCMLRIGEYDVRFVPSHSTGKGISASAMQRSAARMEISHPDGEEFTFDEYKKIERCINALFSFLSCSPASIHTACGLQTPEGSPSWRRWVAPPEFFGCSPELFNSFYGGYLPQIAKGFSETWFAEKWSSQFERALYFYGIVHAYENRKRPDVKMLAAVIGLEILSYTIWEEEWNSKIGDITETPEYIRKYRVSDNAGKVRRISLVDRVRAAAIKMELPQKIPSFMASEIPAKAVDRNWSDAFDLVVTLRNDLVHKEIRHQWSFTALSRISVLASHMLDLFLLYLCRYDGVFRNRNMPHGVAAVDWVPWSVEGRKLHSNGHFLPDEYEKGFHAGESSAKE